MTKLAFRYFMDYEKEEKWLNEMESRGYHFLRYCFLFYIFTIGEPNTYTYRIELLENMTTNNESRSYLDFLADTDIEHVASWARWVYLRKEKEKGSFDLFTDLDSKLKHFRRIFFLQLGLAPLLFVNFINLMNMTLNEGGVFLKIVDALYVLLLFFFIIYGSKTYLKIKKIRKHMKLHE
ncbi:DUF2812 domain-containing protein [Vallitalea guaymasensis]|uniref:DUF2812 domain-containing protein n=1 Tax=Vallitalea guaymasensis TaxID=1185412 RepID=UPI002729B06C|nr:DUF2812 domain-containing protein [Vallitalea guaymasensis]